MKNQHHPVLLNSVLDALSPKIGESYLDATAGYGGHATSVIDAIGADGRVILVDRDANAVAALAEKFKDRAQIIHASFYEAAQRLFEDGTLVDMILLDLGVSSPQLDNAERGFSFRAEAPLDMRMDQSEEHTAADVVNHTPLRELERIIREYGEEPKARAVAQAIVAHRPFATTTELARVVRTAAFHPKEIDAATRTFQAIRIEVNGELEQLRSTLPIFVKLMAPGGRLAVISFHSLEDRIVKQFMETESRDCICPPKQPVCTCHHVATIRKLTKGALTAEDDEIRYNPRARSAKLRVAEKINQNKRRD